MKQQYWEPKVYNHDKSNVVKEEKKSTILLISAILSLLWMILCSSTYGDVLENGLSDSVAVALGTVIGAAMLIPYMLIAWIGTIFNWVGWLTNKRAFALTAAILFCVALVLCIFWGFGLIPSIILSFIAYAKIKK